MVSSSALADTDKKVLHKKLLPSEKSILKNDPAIPGLNGLPKNVIDFGKSLERF